MQIKHVASDRLSLFCTESFLQFLKMYRDIHSSNIKNLWPRVPRFQANFALSHCVLMYKIWGRHCKTPATQADDIHGLSSFKIFWSDMTLTSHFDNIFFRDFGYDAETMHNWRHLTFVKVMTGFQIYVKISIKTWFIR